MAGFIGEYNHSIDKKGRVIIPARFRDRLGDEFVITKGLDGCLSIYENSAWEAFEEKLTSLPLANANARKTSRQILAGAAFCELDAQGRTIIPAKLREYAGLDKEITLVGVGNRIEIWDRESWDEMNDMDSDALALSMEDLGI